MDSNHKLELINLAIQRLIEEKKNQESSTNSRVEDDDDVQLLLSRLLSQLDSLKVEGTLKQPEVSTEVEELSSAAIVNANTKMESAGEVGGRGVENGTEEIVKELKKVKKQNFVTQCLLSVMIVLTVAWQLSEVSLILKVKEGLNHPFRSVGGMLSGMVKGPDRNGKDTEKQFLPIVEPSSLPSLKIPELPHVDLPDLGLNGENH